MFGIELFYFSLNFTNYWKFQSPKQKKNVNPSYEIVSRYILRIFHLFIEVERSPSQGSVKSNESASKTEVQTRKESTKESIKESTTNTTPPKSLEKKESSGSKQSSGRSSRGKKMEISELCTDVIFHLANFQWWLR